MRYAPETREEAIEWFPEVHDMKDDELREQTIGVIVQMPEYFFTAPASTSHHPPEHQSRHGLVLHTKRVCTAFERLAPSMVNQGHLEWQDIDHGRAACILHDMFKYGIPPTSVDGTRSDHDLLAGDWLSKHTSLPDAVVNCVEAHNGAWYAGPKPTTHLQQIVHIADMNASDENAHYAIKEPHPILKEQFPAVMER